MAQMTIGYRAAQLWNQLPHSIRTSNTLQAFKNNLKNYYILHYT